MVFYGWILKYPFMISYGSLLLLPLFMMITIQNITVNVYLLYLLLTAE